MLDFFIEYMNFECLGRIDNSHLALADQSPKFAFDWKCIKLAELHAEAVDFPKTGTYPFVNLKLLTAGPKKPNDSKVSRFYGKKGKRCCL